MVALPFAHYAWYSQDIAANARGDVIVVAADVDARVYVAQRRAGEGSGRPGCFRRRPAP